MQSMVTITHNNRCAEMLATVRRGPFARPTPEERIEFLLTRVRKTDCKVAFADHALEHTLSFQRRVHSIKQGFLKRAVTTPLGVTQDYWDRMQREITPFVKRLVESNDANTSQENVAKFDMCCGTITFLCTTTQHPSSSSIFQRFSTKRATNKTISDAPKLRT
jgi:hypothetical protein